MISLIGAVHVFTAIYLFRTAVRKDVIRVIVDNVFMFMNSTNTVPYQIQKVYITQSLFILKYLCYLFYVPPCLLCKIHMHETLHRQNRVPI